MSHRNIISFLTIYMLVCFIVINTARNPQNLFHAQVSLKLLLNLLFGKVGITRRCYHFACRDAPHEGRPHA